MRTYFVSCYNQETRKLEQFKVDPNVYMYIRQLEAYIHFPEESGLKDLYSFRFPQNDPDKEIE